MFTSVCSHCMHIISTCSLRVIKPEATHRWHKLLDAVAWPGWLWCESRASTHNSDRGSANAAPRSEGGYQLANVSRSWLGRLLLCLNISSDRYRIYPDWIRKRCFFEKFPHLSGMLDLIWDGPPGQWHFCFSAWPDVNVRSLSPRFLFKPVCRLHRKFG